MNYTKPIVISSAGTAEGVYAASGFSDTSFVEESCYTTTARITQSPELGRGDYRIQVDARHHGDHTREQQVLTIEFNQPVTYKSSNGNLISGDGSSALDIELNYHQNPNDNIGFGDLIVEADAGLAILDVAVYD